MWLAWLSLTAAYVLGGAFLRWGLRNRKPDLRHMALANLVFLWALGSFDLLAPRADHVLWVPPL